MALKAHVLMWTTSTGLLSLASSLISRTSEKTRTSCATIKSTGGIFAKTQTASKSTTDYNRHLEQLFERVATLLIDSLRTTLNIDELEQVAELHKGLIQVRRLFDENIVRTIDAETKLFLHKIEELSKLVMAMRQWEPSHELELSDIKSKLKNLSISVKQDKCLNAGGKFEWVDSVLVKCLQDGTWLLIDQVNLCSPAVLDRLNGLLEPNGVLSIGERGVDGDGNVVTIKPHENFRLFLTMDPRYGEISRAMRNRGVEIYMLDPKKNVDYDAIDLKSLVFNAGVVKSTHRDALLEIYDKMSDESVAVDRLSMIDLLHTAFLVKQRSLRGFSAKQLIRDSCIDVYINARPTRDPRLKEYFVSLIDQIIEQYTAHDNEISVIDLNAATWSLKNLHDNPIFTVMKQQGLLLNTAAKMYKLRGKLNIRNNEKDVISTKLLNDFCNLRENEEFVLNVDVAEILPYFLLNFYELSSQNDAPLRKEWLSKTLRGNTMFDELEKKSALMAKVITLFSFRSADRMRSSLPWDLWQLIGRTTGDKDDSSDTNKLLLLLYASSMILESGSAPTEAVRKKSVISVKQYSTVVLEGKILSQLKNQPLVTCFAQFLKRANSCIAAILRDSNVSTNPKEYVEARKELKWYTRFEKLGEMTLINKLEKSEAFFKNLEQISLLLKIHYKWLLKFLHKLFAIARKFPNEKIANEIEHLLDIVDNINDQLELVYDPMKKISKKIKKYLILPSPHSSETSMNVHLRLRTIAKDFSVRDESGNSLKRELKILFVQLKDSLMMRYQTIRLWCDIYSREPIGDTILRTILEVERFCDESHIRLRVPVEIENVLDKVYALPGTETAHLNAKIQLWPIYEYIFLSFAYKLQGEMCLQGTSSAAISTECLAKFADVPSIPINLISLLNVMARKEVERRQKTLLLPELFCRLEQFTRQSYAVKGASRLLHWRGITEKNLEKSLTLYSESKESYFGGPVLLNLVLKFMLRKTNEKKEKNIFSVVELGTYTAQINQLQLLNEILWRNSILLTDKRYDLSNSDLTTLRFYLHVYLAAIDKLHTEHNVPELIATAIKKQGGNLAADIENKLRIDYFEPLEELRKSRDEIEAINNENLIKEEIALRRGKAWMLLGYIQLQFFGNLDIIDPVHKVELKLRYVEEDIVDCRRTMYVTTLQNRILGRSSENRHAHPRFKAMRDFERQLLKTRNDLSCMNAFRPQSINFTSLSSDSSDFRHKVGSYELVKKHLSQLYAIASKIASEKYELADFKVAEIASREAESWSLSVQRFAEQIEEKYLSAYPDVILPLMAALAQVSHGVGILINEIQRLISLRKKRVTDLDSLIHNLIRFPTIDQQQESLLNLSDLCVARNIRNLINESSCSVDSFVKIQDQFRMLKSGLYELYNHVILNRGLTQLLWRDLNKLLQQIVLIWKQQQQEEEKRIAEKNNLYKNKIENHGNVLTEEEELTLEVREMFPTYRERDFYDIEDDLESSLDRKLKNASSEPDETQSSFSGLITKDDIREIQNIHSKIITSFTVSKWIRIDITSIPSTNYVEPLTQRYYIVHGMLDYILPSLSEDLAIKLYNSYSFLVTLGLQENRGTDRTLWKNIRKLERVYDFYKDSNVEEAKQCLPLCENILNRINQLLEQWPDHPTLRSIRCIIERMYTFSITSPVSRFLTGLELLLVKMHQWEENAHKGVSLSDYILALTEQIISWRKLELSCWKGCLDAAHETLKSDTSKWWFFLYALIESYITRFARDDIKKENDEPVTKQKLVESLERFMNESSLVEFESRLNFLLTFHCHVCYFDVSDDKNEILAILWNMYNYYKQFVDDVNTRIAALKAPIEKKLKDFVKIARWNDISYWAVKETVEKTHRTLHKFVKEFQKALKQNVSFCLAVKSESYSTEMSKGIWDDQDHRKYVIIPEDFIITKSSGTVKMEVLFTSGLITRTNMLLEKAKYLCKEIVLTSSYPFIRSELENLIGDFMEQSARLRNMDIDRSLPKGKQKSQAKSILQQKKLTLANYFKELLQLGVSYRTGVLILKNDMDKVIDFTISPLDLSVINQYFKLRNIDHHMLMQWQGCEKYYYKSLIKLNALNAMLSTCQTDLGLQNMERCRGFSAHMMLMAHRQKKTIIQSFECFSSLRIQISNLTETREEDLSMSKQRDGQDCTEILKTLLITLEAGFEQLLLFLQCCPVESSTDTNRTVLTLDINALPIIAACQNDEVWKNANTLLKDNLDLIKVTAKRFNILFMAFKVLSVNHSEHSVRTSFLSSKHFEFLEQCRVTIEVVRTRNKELKQLFENSDVAHPIQESIIFLDTKMECFLNKYKNLRKVVGSKNGEKQLKVNNDAVKQYELSLEQLINMILLVIQKKYKDHVNVNDEVTNVREKLNEENNENDNDMEEEIEKNRLSKKLIEFLEKDIIELKLSKIYDLFFSLLLSIHEFDLQSANYCIRLLLQCLPLLEQYIFLVQFYLNEQVAAFRITCKMLYLQLNVFLDLAANGFCNPKDLDLEEGETDESGEKIEKGGMGLADGEGTKNVSDRIESEDQLEDTKSAEQEQEKQDDKICKEEEKGIEMSEDFDSKPQDTEKGDDDKEQDNDENENDLDKEMGETGEGAEQLDKEIWDDDTESEENSEQNDNEEEGTSKQTDEKIIGAKDDRDKRKHDDDDTSENREENQKEINEMEESEVDEDQINPYHGKFDPLPEPEPLDLPEDMNLDEDGKEDNSNEEENPFDIDEMKNSKPPPEKKDETFEKEFEKNKENDFEEDCSEEENDNVEDINTNGQKTQEEPETNKETEENNRENAESETKNEEQQQDELEKEKLPEKAAPSVDDASKEIDAASQVEETIGGSRDTVAEQSDKDEQEASADNTQQNNNDKGTGQSQSAQQESGHSGSSKQEATPISQKNTTELMEKRKNLGEKNEDRSLLDWIEPALKKLKTTFTKDEIQRNKKEEDDSGNSNTIDLAQHIKDSEKFDDYTLDVATEDQAREQASNIEKEKENQDETKNDAMDIKMHDDEENITHDEVAKKELEVFEESETADNKRKEINGKCSNVNVANDSQPEETEEIEMELEERETMLVQRAPETTFHTMEWSLEDVESSHVENKRFEVEKMLSEWTQMPSTKEAAAAWNYLCSITDSAARDLSEKLRLVLEPTQFSRLKGDYKTGKRINMRKIIPYIASEFRKDKIWLRRTKASKRDYQIILALDDSRSMMNNQCKEMTFESLSLISKAMTYLEVGKLGIVSFGENVKVLHPLGETFTEQSGSRIIQEMRFNQELTRVAQLLDFTIDMFENQRASLDHAKLLVVLSDGRNVYADAINTVKRAVRRARLLDIFLVFVIIDNPNKKDSILDIVWPVFDGDQVVEFKSYMDFFPFPFYIHVRDMNTLPEVLSDALRQWFELVGKIDI
ncbi:midasin-like [Pseudomyrmex gracilis]|uniref:midasin-like n=1 Tax=Pseudomyrmex gracilis TaxID=219809 RepID=UPI000995842F|nr:midasin-like [Pseudomyrmex gracilis]